MPTQCRRKRAAGRLIAQGRSGSDQNHITEAAVGPDQIDQIRAHPLGIELGHQQQRSSTWKRRRHTSGFIADSLTGGVGGRNDRVTGGVRRQRRAGERVAPPEQGGMAAA